MLFLLRSAVLTFLPFVLTAAAQTAWVMRRNENAQVLPRMMAKFQPEAAARFEVVGVDQEISERVEPLPHRSLHILP